MTKVLKSGKLQTKKKIVKDDERIMGVPKRQVVAQQKAQLKKMEASHMKYGSSPRQFSKLVRLRKMYAKDSDLSQSPLNKAWRKNNPTCIQDEKNPHQPGTAAHKLVEHMKKYGSDPRDKLTRAHQSALASAAKKERNQAMGGHVKDEKLGAWLKPSYRGKEITTASGKSFKQFKAEHGGGKATKVPVNKVFKDRKKKIPRCVWKEIMGK